jgi:hypothetical protein
VPRLADLLDELARLSKKIIGGVGDCWIDATTFETSYVVIKSRHTRTKSCYAFAKSNSLATESTSTVVGLSYIATGSIFIAAELNYDVGGSCCKILATQRLSNQHHIYQNKLLATHELRRIKLCPDLSNSLVTESTFATVNLTYIIIYSTTTTIGLTSTVAGWTSAATNRASYDDTARSSYKVSRTRIKKTLPSKLGLLCLARWGNHTRRARGSKHTKYTLNILHFFEIDGKRCNMGRRPLRENTWIWNAQPTSVMGQKIRCHGSW